MNTALVPISMRRAVANLPSKHQRHQKVKDCQIRINACEQHRNKISPQSSRKLYMLNNSGQAAALAKVRTYVVYPVIVAVIGADTCLYLLVPLVA